MRALKHDFAWVRPSPLWQSGPAQDVVKMQRPAILAFKSDGFMQELAARLERAAGPDVTNLEAVPESFAERLPGDPPPTAQTLKLFQAVHGRHYLVAASLVCQLPGLPDHGVQRNRSERAQFVLRRLGADGVSELAWVSDGATPPRAAWQGVADRRAVADGEELLPLYPVLYPEGPRKRRILVGLVPTVSRETYETSAVSPALADVDPRGFEIRARVIEPLAGLMDSPADPSHDELDRQGSVYLLLDLADLLAQHLPAVWQAVRAGGAPAGARAAALYQLLDRVVVAGTGGRTLRRALVVVMDEHTTINAGGTGTLHCDLRDSNKRTGGDLDPEELAAAIDAALAERPLPDGTAPPTAGVPKLDKPLTDDDPEPARYVLRAVYRRPQCTPPHPDLVSNPSEAFQIAPHFDFEAPARPIRISLPFDTSISGLRKFKKSVGFVMSRQLRKQLCRSSTKFEDVIKGKLQDCNDVNFGEICAFSIPILTIVAMILMMIIVSLLNIVFWWIPFLKICLPIRSSR